MQGVDMASYTKLMKKQQEQVHEKIMDGYRRGVCSKNGETIKVNGRPVAKPRVLGHVTYREVFPREYAN
jgi:hypothetical protein